MKAPSVASDAGCFASVGALPLPVAEPALDATTQLTRAFFARDVVEVARDLLGRFLVRDRGTPDEVVLRVTETEAYGGPEDSASHCRAGRTARNAPMWGPPGGIYVYVCYGLHQMLNLVTGDEGQGQAVLVRACELVRGEAVVTERRGMPRIAPTLLAGPGKVGAALALDRSFSGASIVEPGPLEAHAGEAIDPRRVLAGARIGVEFANARDRAAKRRFALAGTPWVTHRASLRPARAY